ncbi:hypothetical protein [Maribacter sp. 2308TA10-17]|uniref:hypothetical protein n=1 Tax=Maribacter sp. 2308TA10-17 TaxID=3386276 RepID=UPI0039BC9536
MEDYFEILLDSNYAVAGFVLICATCAANLIMVVSRAINTHRVIRSINENSDIEEIMIGKKGEITVKKKILENLKKEIPRESLE